MLFFGQEIFNQQIVISKLSQQKNIRRTWPSICLLCILGTSGIGGGCLSSSSAEYVSDFSETELKVSPVIVSLYEDGAYISMVADLEDWPACSVWRNQWISSFMEDLISSNDGVYLVWIIMVFYETPQCNTDKTLRHRRRKYSITGG